MLIKKFTRAVIFDRDNTIINDRGYTHLPEDLSWKRGIISLIKILNFSKIGVFVATNQGGIGLKKFSKNQLNHFHEIMKIELSQINAVINEILFCPHHPNAILKSQRHCKCRKPKTGMILQILKKYKLKNKNVLFVGDSIKDQLCAKKARIKFLKAPVTYNNNYLKLIYKNIYSNRF